jgi:hypothetical protein
LEGVIADNFVRQQKDLVHFLGRYHNQIFDAAGAIEFVDKLHGLWMAEQPGTAVVEPSEPTPPPAPEHCIFISYASENRSAAQAVYNRLASENLPAWIDVDERRKNIAAGSKWHDVLRRNVRACAVFLPLVSEVALEDRGERIFREEWDWALERIPRLPADARFIIPLAIDDVDRTSEAIPYALRELDWWNARGGDVSNDLLGEIRSVWRMRVAPLIKATR